MTTAPDRSNAPEPEALPRVLLVGEEDASSLSTALALRSRGFEVDTFASDPGALEDRAGRAPDLVVLDIVKTDHDGFASCERLRALPEYEHVPVLVLSSLDDEATIDRAYRAGATDFLVRTPQWSLLEGRLRYLLRAFRTQQELRRSRTRLARALDLARMGSFDWYPVPGRWDGRLELSPEAYPVLGLAPGAEVGLRHLFRRVPRAERHGVLRMMGLFGTHRSVMATDVTLQLPDGRRRVIHLEAEPERPGPGGDGSYTGVMQDVTDRRSAEDKIRHLANFDALTGLPNRRQLLWRTERALEYARRQGHLCGLLLIDLDRFKVINDTLGHAAGDELLAEVARRLRACVRHSEQVTEVATDAGSNRAHRTLEAVGRLGGDEFVALLPEVATEEDAERVASRILESMALPIYVAGQECIVTASVGVALFPRDGTNMLDLMRNADVAMYSVKASGRNAAAVYAPNLATGGRERLELEAALYKALERHELVLYYQPKVDVQQGRIVGAEALMRWNSPHRQVPPGEFIPLAEEIGLILPMSQWALGETARQLRDWKDRFGFSQAIAVNLPSRLFERADLVDHLRLSALACGVPLGSIQLEITETGLMKGEQGAFPALQRLRDIGVRISVDDFGTGYSSLSYLTSLPISELKIDGSFVRDLGRKPGSEAVAGAIIALAGSLGLRVVAEGVETEQQAQVLYNLGCHVMQGYYFSRPLAADEFEKWAFDDQAVSRPDWVLTLEDPLEEPAEDGSRGLLGSVPGGPSPLSLSRPPD